MTDAAISAPINLQETIKWNPVTDGLPPLSEDVLVMTGRGVWIGQYTQWHKDRYPAGWYDVRFDCSDCRSWRDDRPLNWPLEGVTHWATIPDGPSK